MVNEYDIYHIHIDSADEQKFEFQWCEKCFRVFNIGVQLGKGYERQAMRNLLDERQEHDGGINL